jgi:hypothetical protein
MVPLSWFPDRTKLRTLGGATAPEIVPLNRLRDKLLPIRDHKREREREEMALLTHTCCKAPSCESVLGNGLVSWLSSNDRYCNADNCPIVLGIVPFSWLFEIDLRSINALDKNKTKLCAQGDQPRALSNDIGNVADQPIVCKTPARAENSTQAQKRSHSQVSQRRQLSNRGRDCTIQ